MAGEAFSSRHNSSTRTTRFCRNTERRRSQPDVHAFPGHIACSATTRSEIVVPVLRPDGSVLALLDVDSDRPGAFDETDREHLEALCRELGTRYAGG